MSSLMLVQPRKKHDEVASTGWSRGGVSGTFKCWTESTVAGEISTWFVGTGLYFGLAAWLSVNGFSK